MSLLWTTEELCLAGWIRGSIWLMTDRLTALVEIVDAGDVIGTHVPGSKDLVWVGLSEESRLTVLGEGEPCRVEVTFLVVSVVFTCIGRVKRKWCALTCCNAWRRSSRREYPSCLCSPWQSFQLFLGRTEDSTNVISLQLDHLAPY